MCTQMFVTVLAKPRPRGWPPAADIDYAFDLADALESAVPQQVDVRVINDAPLGFRYNVSRGIPLRFA